MTKPDEPAFPETRTDPQSDPGYVYSSGGLTKREYFAAMAMQGLLAKDEPLHDLLTAQRAVEHANALIAELEKND